ncbi:MAG: hypothetical protein Q7U54_10440 [Bacteroidales bacterium]|nr:hypothetical protein [Bacteroidales bacterium]
MINRTRKYSILFSVLLGAVMFNNVQAKSKPGKSANQCTSLEKGGFTGNPNELFIRNNCYFAINVSWCTEKDGKICADPGAEHIDAGKTWPLLESHGRLVHIAACEDPALAFIDRKNPDRGRCGKIPDNIEAAIEKNQAEESNKVENVEAEDDSTPTLTKDEVRSKGKAGSNSNEINRDSTNEPKNANQNIGGSGSAGSNSSCLSQVNELFAKSTELSEDLFKKVVNLMDRNVCNRPAVGVDDEGREKLKAYVKRWICRDPSSNWNGSGC